MCSSYLLYRLTSRLYLLIKYYIFDYLKTKLRFAQKWVKNVIL